MEKFIITACICGAEVTKEHNPAVPYTVEEIAEQLCVSKKVAYALVKSGQIAYVRAGRAIRVSKDSFDKCFVFLFIIFSEMLDECVLTLTFILYDCYF